MKLTVDIKIKDIIRILAVVILCCFAIPSFAVSCGKQDVNISGTNMLIGISLDTEVFTGPNLGALILFAIPVVIFILWSISKKKNMKEIALITVILSIIGWLGWILTVIAVAVYSDKYYCEFAILPGFFLNFFGYALLLIFSAKAFVTKRSSSKKPVKIAKNEKTQVTGKQIEKLCPQCKKPLKSGFSFCTHCGTNVS